MKAQAKMHEHPKAWSYSARGKRVFVYGYQLEPGDIIQATDVYDSTNGNWEPAPCPGQKLGEGVLAVWIRPA